MKKIDVESGEVTFEGFRFRWIVTVLHSSVEFSEEMPENHERGIINRAVRSVASTGTITSGRLLHAIGEGEEAFKQQPSEAFVLVTSLSARRFEGLANRKMGDISLSFNRYLPAPFHAEHEKARAIARDQVIGRLPKMGADVMWAYMLTRVSVQARSHQEALEMALDALDLLRGVWNLALNREVGMRSSGGIRKPVNRLVLGPIHSLHAPNGNLIDESPWIDDDYVGPLVTYNMMPDWDYIQEFEDFVWQELSRIPYRRDLETSIRMYTRALDARDWNTSFVRLWALLETLTATYRH